MAKAEKRLRFWQREFRNHPLARQPQVVSWELRYHDQRGPCWFFEGTIRSRRELHFGQLIDCDVIPAYGTRMTVVAKVVATETRYSRGITAYVVRASANTPLRGQRLSITAAPQRT